MNSKFRLLFLVIIDSIIVSFAIFLGYYILEPFFVKYEFQMLFTYSIILLISHHIFAYIFNLYNRAWEYASIREMMAIVKGVTSSLIATALVTYFIYGHLFYRLILITWMMHVILIGGSRLSWRVIRNYVVSNQNEQIPTLIVGAGKGGNLLINQMLKTPSMGMRPVVVVDDDLNKKNIEISDGLKVRGTTQDINYLVKKFEIKKIVIAIPSLEKKKLNDIYNSSLKTGVGVMIMPNIDDIMTGKLEVSNLKKVEVEDLLGREPVELDISGIETQVMNKKVLITGAGGSIGSEIVRQISKFYPKEILLLGHGENSIYLIHEEMTLNKTNIVYTPLIADIQDKERIEHLFSIHKPDIVYHAAAHKHVPLMESNPIEAVKNNILGTKNVIEASVNNKVEKFVMISTDKAVNPPNIMGATKRVAEMLVQAYDKITTETTLVAVRFGNVLGSRGSVIPKFRKQIEAGGPITVTDERMTRYFMTIPEASRLVIQASALAEGGEVFVLDMGEPVKIVELARKMIKLSGYSEEEIGIRFSGIRPGEKLFEELLKEDEVHPEQVYEKIHRGKVASKDLEEIQNQINKILTEQNFSKDLIEFANLKK
ncbi:polysaccharide biosynthesis protein [Macrococcus armenti]|uniref:polysaccharide biosynthesis protein n=1 Tax=Macrococcus armenti TaxID=2875764 RepID=UPI001CC8F2DA|nr:nucleoside-diphosphate sugar epimerase/dehydratase [Macrococcus armenti]UBH09358.1 polysaccharide biosynthesis protein [Macrococcus armenti]